MSRIGILALAASMCIPSISFAEPFCDEWAKYIDAFDMVPAHAKALPYSMEKYNGDLVKGAMGFNGENVFVPEPSESLLKGWPNPDTATILKDKMAKFYDAKKN